MIKRKRDIGAELIEAMEEVVAFAKGEPSSVRIVSVPPPIMTEARSALRTKDGNLLRSRSAARRSSALRPESKRTSKTAS